MAEKVEKQVGLQLTPHQVVVRPLVTEKGVHKSTRHNRYAFEVHPMATKSEIKAAIEDLFNVKVTFRQGVAESFWCRGQKVVEEGDCQVESRA
jgi:hypothetical protein